MHPSHYARSAPRPGAGVIVVLGETSCGLAESARIARYLADQNAGQCGPCVHGLPAVADDVVRLARGEGRVEDITRLQHRLGQVNGRGACRHPDAAMSLVRSALAVFAGDVAAHGRGSALSALAQTHRPALSLPHQVVT